jgi:hypothetical protein
LAALLASGCAGTSKGRLQVWVQDDVYDNPVRPSAANGRGSSTRLRPDARDGQVTLAGAINETLSFCLVVSLPAESPTAGIEPLTVTASDLQSGEARIPANAMRLYRVHDVTVDRWPGWHIRSVAPQDRLVRVPDVLVPIESPKGGLAERLRGGEAVKLWVDVHIPKGTAPATYFGQIELGTGDGGGPGQLVGLSVTVWPFVLPEAGEVTLLTEIDHQRLFAHHVTVDGRPHAPSRQWADTRAGAELDDLLTATMRLLRSHKVTPLLTRLAPVVKVEAGGDVTVDWDDYDRVVGGLLDGSEFFDRQPLRLWCVPFHEGFPPPPTYGAMSSPTYSKMARQYLARCAEHFAERGWLERSFVALPHVTDFGSASYAAVRHFGRLVRGADHRLRTMAPLFPQDMSAYGWDGFAWEDVGRQVDIWSPPAQFFDADHMEAQRMQRRRTFWSLDRPPFSGSIDLAAGPADTRVIAWQARTYDVEAVMLGSADRWPANPDSASPQSCCQSGVAPLIYPGRFFGLSMPVPSARLKRLRRSMQDLAYLELLEQRRVGHIASVLTESLAPWAASDAYGAHYGDGKVGAWSGEARLWSVARQIMADEIIRSIRRDDGGARRVGDPAEDAVPNVRGTHVPTNLADTVQWRRFMEATRRLKIEIDGVRVRPIGPSLAGAVEVVVSVTLVNLTRASISGQLAFEDLPITWQAQPPEVEVPEIAPQDSRRVSLRATAGVMETDAGGVRYLPMILRTSHGQAYRFSARMGYLAATPVHRPLEIDGDLSDWPSAVGSAAQDFVLVTGEDPRAPALPSSRSTQNTLCFMAGDGEALYFAFNCAIAGSDDLPRGQRNYIRYEDGVPVGEELVEILLDPANAGTRSTSDLFHVVIAPSGWFCERGIGTDPPTGVRRPWAAGLSVAAQIHEDRWAAEVRIPLDAFGVRGEGRQIWGVNFTRFDLARQEYSTWSGVNQSIHDPLALGNLALPQAK